MTPRIRLTLWYVFFLSAVGSLHPYLAVVLDDAGASGTEKAAILSLFPIGAVFAGPALTWLADRTGRGVLVLRCSIVLSALAGLVMLAELPLPGIVLCLGLLSFARSPASSIADMLTAERLGLGRSGYGGVRAWGSVGFIASAGGVGLMLDGGSNISLQIHGLMLLVLMAITLSISEGPPVPRKVEPMNYREVLTKPSLIALYLVGILHQSTISFYDHFYALHVSRSLELGAWVASGSIAIGVGLEVLVLFRGHALLRRIGLAKLLLLAIASGIPRWLITAEVTSPGLLIATQSLHGLGFGAWWVAAIAIVDREAPGRLRNSAQGLFIATSHGMGSFVAMGVAALLLDRVSTGSAFLGSAVSSSLALIAALVFLLPAIRTSGTKSKT